MKAKKLIEVALPIKEISAESIRDKSLRHGHISTLQYWLARRPLPVCRAVVFSSLVPDPIDEHCPVAFRDAVTKLLGRDSNVVDWYKPYDDIPYTAIKDKMDDNLRNRLMMFIGKFSEKCQNNMMNGKDTNPKEQLSDGSLIKWENKNNPRILRIARELIWVAYNSDKKPNVGYETLHKEFDNAFNAVTRAEEALYSAVDRHIKTNETETLENDLQHAIENFQNQMPSVFDPFAGGGAIPLEAARLGCRSYGNDINPVAHIIERATVEFPQKYGKPITITDDEFYKIYGDDGLKLLVNNSICIDTNRCYNIPNRLAFDVEYYSRRLLKIAETKVCSLYPSNENGEKPIGYYWLRYGKCSNPSCGKEIPLLKSFSLSTKKGNEHSIFPQIENGCLHLRIRKEKNTCKEPYFSKGNLTCPFCGAITDSSNLKKQCINGELEPKLVGLIYDTPNGKEFVEVDERNLSVLSKLPPYPNKPTEKMHPNSGGGDTLCWGISRYSQLFLDRQLYSINALIESLDEIKSNLGYGEYNDSIYIYLALLINRITPRSNMFVLLNTVGEKLEHIYRNQAIPMVFDFPESGIFCESMGGAYNQIMWMVKVIESESSNSFMAQCFKTESGDIQQFKPKSLYSVITDPPYYDAMAYADFSDFYYLWFKQTLHDVIPDIVSTPQTPKTEECTALKHYHDGSEEKAKRHFEKKLTEIFDAIEQQTAETVSIMFAHQSTEAWTTLCNSILSARMNITGSWPIDTERGNAGIKTDKAFLESSVTVACRPSERKGYGDYKDIKKEIERKVAEEVESLYGLGFRGADLITACFGQAVSEFGKYKTVEKSDGSEVSVADLLDMARNAAVNSLLKGVPGDDMTRFYTGWLQLNGTGDTDFDDATKFTRVGINVNINDIKQEKILILEGKKMHLAMSEEHLGHSMSGMNATDSLIDQAHRAIIIFREGNRQKLLRFVRDIAPESTSPLWRLLETLKELLPANDDYKQVQGLLQNADDLRQHCNDNIETKQGELIFD